MDELVQSLNNLQISLKIDEYDRLISILRNLPNESTITFYNDYEHSKKYIKRNDIWFDRLDNALNLADLRHILGDIIRYYIYELPK